MGWRNVIISRPAHLSLSSEHLVIKQSEEVPVPLEDISVILVESGAVTITSALLNRLAEKTIPLFICDPGHLPSGLFLSFQKHSRYLKVLRTQMEQTSPFRKQCWKRVVAVKLENQARCLELLEKPGAPELRALVKELKSGDSTNREGVGARIYFDSYMPSTTRQEDNCINSALNYGYAVMRGLVARGLTSYGFLPAVGIHHRDELNQFNLADDFMEILRPLVDLYVAGRVEAGSEFTVELKAELVSLLNYDLLMSGARQSVTRAVELMCRSYSRASSSGKPELLELPLLMELKPNEE